MNPSLNDRVCHVCEKPGQLLQCSGGCLHSYHKECLGLSSAPSGRWRCSDCTRREHRCFHCKNYSPDHKLIQCSVPNCKRFFHWDAACSGQSSIKHVSSFVCPCHICSNCGGRDARDNPIIKCIRCTKSYHLKCIPPDVIKVDGRYFSCASHRNETATMPSQSTYLPHTAEPPGYQPGMPSPMVPPPMANPMANPMAPPMAPMGHSPMTHSPMAQPPMAQPNYQQYPMQYPAPYYGAPAPFYPPMKREGPPVPEVQIKRKKVKMVLTDELRAVKTLLSPWRDLRKAGIEIKEDKIKQRAILLKTVMERTQAQEKNTLNLREKMNL